MLAGLQQSKGAFVPPSQHKSIKFSVPYRNNDVEEKSVATPPIYENKQIIGSVSKDEPEKEPLQDIKENFEISNNDVEEIQEIKTDNQIDDSDVPMTQGGKTEESQFKEDDKLVEGSNSGEEILIAPNDQPELKGNQAKNEVIKLSPTAAKKKYNQLTNNVNVKEETIESYIPAHVEVKQATPEAAPEPVKSGETHEVAQNKANVEKLVSEESEQEHLPDSNDVEDQTLSQEENSSQASIITLEQKVEEFFQEYVRAYQQRNVVLFSRYFAEDAEENGEPFSQMLPVYKDLFNSTSELELKIIDKTISLEDNIVVVGGNFSVMIEYKDGKRIVGEGKINFKLIAVKNLFLINNLIYEFIN